MKSMTVICLNSQTEMAFTRILGGAILHHQSIMLTEDIYKIDILMCETQDMKSS